MPFRVSVAEQLAQLLGALAHPHRVRIIEELRSEERDVNALQLALGITHSRVSQHLGVLRSLQIVAERREGRHVYYSLVQPEMAAWLLQGLDFVEARLAEAEAMRSAVAKAREVWQEAPASGD